MARPRTVTKPNVKGFIGYVQLVQRIKETTCWAMARHGGFRATIDRGELCFKVVNKIRHPVSKEPMRVTHYLHTACMTHWLEWKVSELKDIYRELGKDGKIMGRRPSLDLPEEEHIKRGKMVRERSRQIKLLERVTSDNIMDKVPGISARIAQLTNDITATGYPVGKYGGRSSKVELWYTGYIRDIKTHYESWNMAPLKGLRESLTDIPGGIMTHGDRFDRDMEEWRIVDERRLAELRRRRGMTHEDQQTDEGVEDR